MGSPPRLTSRFLQAVVVALVGLTPLGLGAQATAADGPMPLDIFVGSERERYLRVLQTLGVVRLHPWSIRAFSPKELDSLRPQTDSHPWARLGASPASERGRVQQQILPGELALRYNTGFPYGFNDGAVWAGRGLTVAALGGAAVRRGPMSLIVAPTAFWSQNASFSIPPTGFDGNLRFVDPLFLLTVDRPQRFGDAPYARFDPGQSTARVDHFGVAFGASTANGWWGPMTEFPFLLGNNAPGFTHLFLGTALPANVWIGRVHVRVVFGALGQSDYTNITGPERRRLASAAIATFSPRGVPGLELGAARFFHTVWPDSGIGTRQLRKPFESLLKLALPRREPESVENQLASAFFRWVMPRGGFEVYGEYGRDDHSGDSRDLLQEPDHTATYGLGLQKAWQLGTGSIFVLGGEVANFEISHLVRHRQQGGLYAHNGIRQGHTHRGQLLGTGWILGSGAASSLRLERYAARGSESITLIRAVRVENENASPGTSRCVDACLDVQYALRAGRLRRHWGLETRYGVTAVYELNRNLTRDAVNVSPDLQIRWYP